MALNVNIIGRDSEGNLRALKVNSEGNLEISDKDFATESTLSIIKDNQGRLYGKYGEEWLPIPVDSTGRLLLASDVTVNAEGLTVDLGQIKQGPAGTEPWPVQLSGTMDTREVISPRALLTEGEKGVTVKNVPTGAKGLVAQLIVHGISGTWDANGGVSFRMAHYSQSRSAYHYIYDSMNSSSPGDIVVKMYPGLGTAVPTGTAVKLTNRWSNVNDILEERIGFRIDMTGGTFSEGQGVDCELRVRWLY